MSDILTVVAIFAGFTLFVLAVAKLGGSKPDSLSGLFTLEPLPARPQGVQEDDLPRFVFHDIPWRASTSTPATLASPVASAAGQLAGARAA